MNVKIQIILPTSERIHSKNLSTEKSTSLVRIKCIDISIVVCSYRSVIAF